MSTQTKKPAGRRRPETIGTTDTIDTIDTPEAVETAEAPAAVPADPLAGVRHLMRGPDAGGPGPGPDAGGPGPGPAPAAEARAEPTPAPAPGSAVAPGAVVADALSELSRAADADQERTWADYLRLLAAESPPADALALLRDVGAVLHLSPAQMRQHSEALGEERKLAPLADGFEDKRLAAAAATREVQRLREEWRLQNVAMERRLRDASAAVHQLHRDIERAGTAAHRRAWLRESYPFLFGLAPSPFTGAGREHYRRLVEALRREMEQHAHGTGTRPIAAAEKELRQAEAMLGLADG